MMARVFPELLGMKVNDRRELMKLAEKHGRRGLRLVDVLERKCSQSELQKNATLREIDHLTQYITKLNYAPSLFSSCRPLELLFFPTK